MANTNRIGLRKNERIISVMGGRSRKQEKQRHLEVEGEGSSCYASSALWAPGHLHRREAWRLEKWEIFNILEAWQKEITWT